LYYLHIKTLSGASGEANRLAPIHGPFATPQEAQGFFTKLQLWYPLVMRQAEYEVVEPDSCQEYSEAPPHAPN
jgi:hypothetical protein